MAGDLDLFTSLRPKIGKTFVYPHLEEKKKEILDSCRKQLMELAKEELALDIEKEKTNLYNTYRVMKENNVPQKIYDNISNKNFKFERDIIERRTQGHNRKMKRFLDKRTEEESKIDGLILLARENATKGLTK